MSSKVLMRILSMILTIMVIIGSVPVITAAADTTSNPNEGLPEKPANTNRYFFYAPEFWLEDNAYSDSIGIYWWEGTDPCDSWPGHEANPTNVDGIYYYDVPTDVCVIIWNNNIYGGTDTEAEIFKASKQTENIGCEYYGPDENEFYPNGTDNFDNMIYVIDMDKVDKNAFSGKETFKGSWFYYYGNGEYGVAPERGSEVFADRYYYTKPVNIITEDTNPTDSCIPDEDNPVEDDKESLGEIFIEIPDNWFDKGFDPYFNDVYCQIWRCNEATPDMVQTESTLCCDTDQWGKFSYSLSSMGGLEEGVDYFVKFSADIGVTTYETLLNSECIGDTLYWKGYYTEKGSCEYPVYWRNESQHGCGPYLKITEDGRILGRALPEFEGREELFLTYLTNHYEKVTEGLVSWEIQDKIDDAIQAIKITKEQAYELIKSSGVDVDWEYVFTEGDFKFGVKKDKATIKDYFGNASDVVIPETAKGYPVVAIESGTLAYSDNSDSIKTLTIHESIDEICDDWKFIENLEAINVDENNTKLASVDGVLFTKDMSTLLVYPDNKPGAEYITPATVKNIASGAFGNNKNLINVHISEGVAFVGEFAFSGMVNLTSVKIPETLREIPAAMFNYCTKLATIDIHSEITSVNDRAFNNTAFYNTESNWDNEVLYLGDILVAVKQDKSGVLDIKDGTKVIADFAAYSYIGKITEVNLPNSLEYIGAGAFKYQKSMTKVNIPAGVKEIGFYAFADCDGLKSVSIPNSVTSIAYGAFNSCDALAEINIPKSVKSIGRDIVSFTAYSENKANWDKSGLYIDNALVNAEDDEDGVFEVREGTTLIAEKTFDYLYTVKEIVIPDSVRYIHPDVIGRCSELETIRYKGSNVRFNRIIAEIGVNPFEGLDIIFDMELTEELGDSNKDGKLNVKDATAVQKYVAKLISFDDAAVELADFDGDLKVTVKDATAIQKRIAGIITVGAVMPKAAVAEDYIGDYYEDKDESDVVIDTDSDGFYDPSYPPGITDGPIWTGDHTPSLIILGIVLVAACVGCVIFCKKRKDKDDY